MADLMQKFLLLNISSIHLNGVVLGVNAWISANPILVNGTVVDESAACEYTLMRNVTDQRNAGL